METNKEKLNLLELKKHSAKAIAKDGIIITPIEYHSILIDFKDEGSKSLKGVLKAIRKYLMVHGEAIKKFYGGYPELLKYEDIDLDDSSFKNGLVSENAVKVTFVIDTSLNHKALKRCRDFEDYVDEEFEKHIGDKVTRISRHQKDSEMDKLKKLLG